MIRALYTAASGMLAQQMNLDNIANNLANASTTGFHNRRLQFQDLIYQNTVAPGAAATQQTTLPSELQVGLGVRPVSSEIIQTEENFDVSRRATSKQNAGDRTARRRHRARFQ